MSYRQDRIDDDIKQRIAAEISLSETAFVSKSWERPLSEEKDANFTQTMVYSEN